MFTGKRSIALSGKRRSIPLSATLVEKGRWWLGRLRADHLMRNSFYIMLATAATGAFGFLFWLLNSHLFTPAQIGLATSLISATTLIAYISLLGFNTAFLRFLPTSRSRNDIINTGLVFVGLAAVVIAAGYVVIAPSVVPQLDFFHHSFAYAAIFVILTGAGAINLITDSVFISYRSAGYNVVVDGLIQGGTKLTLPLLLTGLGTFGIFTSSGLAALIAASASLYFMARSFGYRPQLRISREVVREIRRFGSATYVANLLGLLPLLALPLIVIRTRSAAEAGYYYVAFQVATLLWAVPFAIAQSLLAEGSYEEGLRADLLKRSAKFQALVMVPVALLPALASHWVLLIFGRNYSVHASLTFAVFALASPVVAFDSWIQTIVRLTKQYSVMILMATAELIGICGGSLLLAHRSLVWVPISFIAGHLVSGLIGGAALLARRREPDRQPQPSLA